MAERYPSLYLAVGDTSYLFTPDDYLLLFDFTGFARSSNDCEIALY
jgi:hypothetical protein